MFQRDYFMRMIQQMTEVVGQMMALRQEKKQEEALLAIDELLSRQFRLNGKLLRSLSDEDIIRMMTVRGVVETTNLHAIALLMKEEAQLLEELDETDQSYLVRVKALHLFIRLALLEAEPLLRTPSEEAGELAAKLGEYELPQATKALLLLWHEAEGRYDQAENVLDELLMDGLMAPEQADEFYGRLLLLTDEKLFAGGLPRDEVIEGQRRLVGNAAIKQQTELFRAE
ncbi:hypothetical protein PAECIP111893_03292 [Paenibacillus plantiphilus]|uniref:Uncharacterized protein n=1 Tax=Paenibacillus plantiphilus TaxID=2905650 RepID=A0ABN8GR69_9BACL|nr:DUF6483 family protein [Paenibacillus plantiphilus]CAH1210821.1 hypothetical protein PAECIP111893_03292 [Paenibacillus plantiphilus]